MGLFLPGLRLILTAASGILVGDMITSIGGNEKGAMPVAWFGPTFRKVGAAFDYATGRLEVSRISSSPRLMRVARV